MNSTNEPNISHVQPPASSAKPDEPPAEGGGPPARVSDQRQHRAKWTTIWKAAAMLARSKAATHQNADGTDSEESQAWAEIAGYFEHKAQGGRGFAAVSPLRLMELTSAAGKAAHALGRAHEFTQDEARAAGALGGAALSHDREHMAEIGRRGGHSRASRTRRA